jgi:hypothetical protein
MSQAGSYSSGGGGGGGIMTINANTGDGSIAGTTVQITTPAANGDGTAVFTGDGSPGTVMTLTFTDATNDVAFGTSSLSAFTSGGGNSSLGALSLQNAQQPIENVAIGYAALQDLIGTGAGDASYNVVIGANAAFRLVSGSINIIIGTEAGNAYTGAESSNILIGNSGVSAENGIIHIGTDGTQTAAYMSGIQGVTPMNGPLQTVVIGTDGQLGSTASGGAGISTIDGNVDSVAGSTITLTTPPSNGDGTALFTGDGFPGTVMTLTFTDGNGNVGLGGGVLSNQSGALFNVALGAGALFSCVSGSGNAAIGQGALASIIGTGISDASGNVGIGQAAGVDIVSGSFNIIMGSNAGGAYSGAESSNILLQSSGVSGESNVIRIGSQGTGGAQQNLAYIAGIQGVTPLNGPLQTVVIGTDGQLGSTSSSGSSTLAYTAVNNAASPYTVLSSDQFIGVDSSGGAVTILLPNAPTTGTSFYIKDATGSAGINFITVTTVGGTVLLDAAAIYTIQYLYGSINLLFNGTQYLIY